MRRRLLAVLSFSSVLVAVALTDVGCSSRPAAAPSSPAALATASTAPPAATALATTPATTTAEGPLAELPYTPGLDVSAMDQTADACVDLYAYSCGGWQKNNPIPDDQTKWDVYGKLTDEVYRHLWGLLLDASKAGASRSPVEKQLGDYFAACTDEKTIEAKGMKPLEPALSSLAAVTNVAALTKWLATEELAGDGALVWDLGTEQDATDSTAYIVGLGARGLSLPDRDDYLAKDPKSVELRAKFAAHAEKLLTVAGDDAKTAKDSVAIVSRIETALARASLTRVERRDPHKVFHRMKVAELQAIAPGIDWKAHFDALGLGSLQVLDVSQPAFMKEVNAMLKREPIDAVKRWLRWRIVGRHAHLLAKAFVDEDFDFGSRYLRGAQALPPRWKRCIGWIDGDLGEALGELFVRKNFGPDVKQRAEAMVVAIQAAMESEIGGLPWMSAATKKEALNKLHTMRNKIGHPKKFRDYSSMRLSPDDFAGNVDHALAFELKRQLARLGKPIDRDEWQETPQTVDAYYDPQMNDMNFPAGVLQPPLFDAKMDDAPNYGNTGGTVGHELTHGFDDEGRQFDAKGNLKDWWTAADSKAFDTRAKCISDQYSSYVAVDDVHVNGKLTLGEDIADLGGLILAYQAWAPKHANGPARDGLTPPQRFFVGYAQWACANVRPETARLRARTDPHSPPRYRIDGVVVNMPEFAQAFSCKPDQPMVKPTDKVCRVW